MCGTCNLYAYVSARQPVLARLWMPGLWRLSVLDLKGDALVVMCEVYTVLFVKQHCLLGFFGLLLVVTLLVAVTGLSERQVMFEVQNRMCLHQLPCLLVKKPDSCQRVETCIWYSLLYVYWQRAGLLLFEPMLPPCYKMLGSAGVCEVELVGSLSHWCGLVAIAVYLYW